MLDEALKFGEGERDRHDHLNGLEKHKTIRTEKGAEEWGRGSEPAARYRRHFLPPPNLPWPYTLRSMIVSLQRMSHVRQSCTQS